MYQLIIKAVNKVKEIGLKVFVLISDQGTHNQALFTKYLNVTEDKPYFFS